jgi:hypothetical protein
MGATKTKFCLSLAFFLWARLMAFAHPMPNSIVCLTILKDKIKGNAQIPMRDLRAVLGEQTQLDALKAYFKSHVRPKSLNGDAWYVEIENARITESTHIASGDYTELTVDFWMVPTSLEEMNDFIFDYDVVCHQVVTHKVFVLMKRGENQTSATIELDIPSEKIKPLQVTMGQKADLRKFSIIGFDLIIVVFATAVFYLILNSKKSFQRNI